MFVRNAWRLTLLFWVTLQAAVANADWTEEFNGGVPQQSWTYYDDAGTRPPDRTTISTSQNNLRMTAVGPPPFSPFDLFAAGAVGLGNPAYSFTDMRVRALVFSPQGMNFAGAAVRGNNDVFVAGHLGANGSTGYVLALDFFNGDVELVRVDGPTTLVDINASGKMPQPFNPQTSYELELMIEGNTLTGRVYDDGALKVTVQTTDSLYTSGWSGVGAAINDNDTIGGSGGTGRTPVTAGFDSILSVSLTARPGDLDGDGQIDRSDLGILASNYGTLAGATAAMGDMNSDGRIGVRDVALLQMSYDVPAGSPVAVPEPCSVILLGIGAVMLCAAGRRRYSAT